MTAPVIQDPREDMQLYCEFDMGGEELYAVKWYKDDHEFFRYSPSGNQKLVQFQVMGVNVDLSKTKCTMTSCSLLLNELSRTFSSGSYRCEVSTEAPTFRLASQTHNISVAMVPKTDPIIDGVNDKYQIGDHIIATCSSGLGDPKPTITWYINRQMVNGKYLKELPQSPFSTFYKEKDRIKPKSTTVQLKILIDKKLTENQTKNDLELICVQSSEHLSVPPKSTTKIIRVTREQFVNNQKLYGVFGSSSNFGRTTSGILIITWVLVLNNFINKSCDIRLIK